MMQNVDGMTSTRINKIENHLFSGARSLSSPNFNERPVGVSIDLLVIHNISLPPGQYGTGCIDDFFCNCLDTSQHAFFDEIADLRVSAHLLIERTGVVKQFVPFNKRAWHAGVSVFEGQENCNDNSIGIELEGCDHESFTDAQYQSLEVLLPEIMHNYPAIVPTRIVGHSDIAPGRKTDPGPFFDWERLFASL